MQYSDQDLIDDIKAGGKNAETAIKFIVTKHKTSVLKLLIRKNIPNIEDVFQESIIAVFLNIQKGLFLAKCSIKTYLISICLNKGFSQQFKANKEKLLGEEFVSDNYPEWNSPEVIFIKKEKSHQFDKLLDTVDPKCKEILSLWSMGYKMKEIADMTEYKNANSVKKKKCMCLKRLMNSLKSSQSKLLLNE